MSVLVTGGAGFIGSHMVRCLRDAGRRVVVVDNLVTGHRDAVPEDVPFVEADVADRARVMSVIAAHGVTAVMHFAGRIRVGESVVDPKLYYEDNLLASIELTRAVVEAGVRYFVFSSTAAVYGMPDEVPISEQAPTRPINPYGETKLAMEHLLQSYDRAYGLRFAALRYFNAAGAHHDGGLGERHEPESHLIPLALRAAAQLAPLTIYGADYPTPDGTCVRDYIHVEDLVEAHLAALAYLESGGESGPFNLGTGRGHSVREIVEACRRVTGRPLPVIVGPRRDGDAASLVASPARAESVLGWRAHRTSLDDIVRDAWTFESRSEHAHPQSAKDPSPEEKSAHAR